MSAIMETIAKLPSNLQIVIGLAVVAHLVALLIAVGYALKPGAKGGRAAFSAELKQKSK